MVTPSLHASHPADLRASFCTFLFTLSLHSFRLQPSAVQATCVFGLQVTILLLPVSFFLGLEASLRRGTFPWLIACWLFYSPFLDTLQLTPDFRICSFSFSTPPGLHQNLLKHRASLRFTIPPSPPIFES